ncbi:hypothetical protein RRG08_027346 [Elysia crispata]|uniref:Uncharacterized protein n=1 Tax=Elysia crispata TaxID=231223 RepID=A0AAE0ZNA7_9GAST|nr:hypothetical protein RRG08_027346 [Elysia crispata]
MRVNTTTAELSEILTHIVLTSDSDRKGFLKLEAFVFYACSDLWALESAYKRSKMGRVSESVWTCTFLLLFVFLTSVPQANAQGTTCQTVRFIGYFFDCPSDSLFCVLYGFIRFLACGKFASLEESVL